MTMGCLVEVSIKEQKWHPVWMESASTDGERWVSCYIRTKGLGDIVSTFSLLTYHTYDIIPTLSSFHSSFVFEDNSSTDGEGQLKQCLMKCQWKVFLLLWNIKEHHQINIEEYLTTQMQSEVKAVGEARAAWVLNMLTSFKKSLPYVNLNLKSQKDFQNSHSVLSSLSIAILSVRSNCLFDHYTQEQQFKKPWQPSLFCHNYIITMTLLRTSQNILCIYSLLLSPFLKPA